MVAAATHPENGTTTEEATIMVVGFVLMTAFWLAMFYSTAWAHRWWGRCVPPSAKEYENERYWLTRHYVGSVMSVLVTCMALPVVWNLHNRPEAVQFMSTNRMAFCRKGDLEEERLLVVVGFAGMMFTGYTIADSFNMFAYKYATWDYVAHHVFFIAAGILIRSHCMMPYNAAILMSMESSTIFLNQLLLHRHRGPSYSAWLKAVGIVFFLLFIFVRIALNTYGAVYLVLNRHYVLNEVPSWQGWFVIVSLVGGTLIQYVWLGPVLKAFGANLLLPLSRATRGTRELLNPAEAPDAA